MIQGLGFCVIYRAKVHPDKEARYIAAWSALTTLISQHRGGLGSRLHKGSDGIWYAYAQWPSATARDQAFSLPCVDPAAQSEMDDCIIERLPEIRLEPMADQLVPVSEQLAGGRPGHGPGH